MSLALDDLESGTQRQVKFRLTVAVFQEIVLNPLDSTTKTIDKSKDTQSLSYDCIPIVIYVRKIVCICLAIKTTMVENLDAVVILIELYRAIRVIRAVANRIHKQLSCSPMWIINDGFFPEHR